MSKAFVLALPLSFMFGFGLISNANAAEIIYANGNVPWFTSGPIDQYQGPDGKYDSQTGFIRSLNGTPCGIECTRGEHARRGFVW